MRNRISLEKYGPKVKWAKRWFESSDLHPTQLPKLILDRKMYFIPSLKLVFSPYGCSISLWCTKGLKFNFFAPFFSLSDFVRACVSHPMTTKCLTFFRYSIECSFVLGTENGRKRGPHFNSLSNNTKSVNIKWCEGRKPSKTYQASISFCARFLLPTGWRDPHVKLGTWYDYQAVEELFGKIICKQFSVHQKIPNVQVHTWSLPKKTHTRDNFTAIFHMLVQWGLRIRELFLYLHQNWEIFQIRECEKFPYFSRKSDKMHLFRLLFSHKQRLFSQIIYLGLF